MRNLEHIGIRKNIREQNYSGFLRFFLLFSQIFCTMYSKFATFEQKTLENRKLKNYCLLHAV
jgi:hypothetical protein